MPESSKEEDLERNTLAALDSVPLVTIRRYVLTITLYISYSLGYSRFFNRTHRFLDAYSRGLNGRQAAWASRKYRGHRVLPESILQELETAHIM